MNSFICMLGVILAVLAVSVTQGCRDMPPGDISEKWFSDVENNGGWDQPLGSKYDPSGVSGAEFGFGSNQHYKGKYRRCMKSVVKVAQMPKDQELDADCYYDSFSKLSCTIKTEDDPVLGNFFKFHGDFVFTKSDDNNFAIVYGCALGKVEHWVALIPKGKDVEPFKQEILDHVKEVLGMSTDEKDLKSEDDPVYFKSFRGAQCKDDKKIKKLPSFWKTAQIGRKFNSRGRRQ